MKQASRKFEIN